MSFKLLMIRDPEVWETHSAADHWPDHARAAVPGIEIAVARSQEQAAAMIGDADAAFGFLPADLLARAGRLRWLCSPQAGPRAGFYHQALVDSDVVVTNMRGIFSDHISAHIMAFLLVFARGMHVYFDRQRQRLWQAGAPTLHLPDATALIVGTGAIGTETARLLAAMGVTVLGVDARVSAPPPGIAELAGPEGLDAMLPRADFVILTVPETPATQGFFGERRFALMKPGAFFINIGRGATVVLDDLNRALRAGRIAGAALDVYQTEPLPAEHPLWDAPNMLMTPHVATVGPYLEERRRGVFVENCRRFAAGQALLNVVDKANWF